VCAHSKAYFFASWQMGHMHWAIFDPLGHF